MDSERRKRIDEIFHAVLSLESSARSAFLAETCEGDDSLRSEVEGLLASHENKSTTFENPTSHVASEFLVGQGAYKETISHYRIPRKIGSGGMGEVYLAEDTRLNRKVALKLLPSEFTNDKERIRRFEKEARAVSALNHPNILTIYDIGKVESGTFIATEYIEGETLRQRMNASRMSLKEVLVIGSQVAEALDAAHRAGIVHRDIKPENIMLRRDGYVKVLDFGLAKMVQRTEGSSLDTISSADTQAGVLIGTIRYMSPEQARGLNLDARTDIFSLGIVLYELIAGRPPFDGASISDILVSILEKQPPALHAYGEFPEELQWIITKALAKDAEERYQTVKELLTDLKRVRKHLEFGEEVKRSDVSALAADRTPEGTAGGTKRRVAVVSIVLVLLAALTFSIMRRDKADNPISRKPFTKIKFTRLTSSGSAYGAAISPDGKYVAYAQESTPGQVNLYLKQLSADTEIQILALPPKTSFYGCRFSPDGEYIYYLTVSDSLKESSLYRMPVLGGISHKLIENIRYGPAISPDGKKLAFVRGVNGECQVITAQADGSNQRKIGSCKMPNCYTDLDWSPDGKIIASIRE